MLARTISAPLPCPTSGFPRTVFACVLLALVCLYALSLAAARAELAPFEHEVVQEMNLARRDPKGYARFLEQLQPYYVKNLFKPPNATPVVTVEGIGAVKEAMRFLRAVRSAPPFSLSRGMSLAARQHVEDQGPLGTTGHQGSDDSSVTERVNRHGTWQGAVSESIAYGNDTARQVVLSFIIDDGVAGRSHRQALFNPAFHVTGVACGAHATYGSLCVVTYAEQYREKGP